MEPRTRHASPRATWLEKVQVRVEGDSVVVAKAIEKGRVLGECTNVARGLSNEPSNVLTPRAFAEKAGAIAAKAGLGVEILDETRIAELKMGLLLGVARGSQEPPRVVVLRYEPKGVVEGPVLGLIGKGITFDTGGISIKPADLMDRMKDDMSGGAAVLCAMSAIARLGASIRCIGVIPLTENMPGGRAFKPGDVLVSAEGKTVEVLNTDAEGRLVLGDALWYARQLGVTHIVDLATLTGACVVALGKSTSGLFGTPDAWRDRVQRASERAGDRSWPMPLFEDYKELFKSEIADFANTGGRAGGAITGALFIQEFAGDLPWVHMDIAGTAWAEEAKPYQAKGATGVGVRTLAELALDAEGWRRVDARRSPFWVLGSRFVFKFGSEFEVRGSGSGVRGSGSMLIQQDPIIVGVVDQPEAARDISLDVVVGMFSMAGVLLLFAALGGLVVGAIFIAIRRARDAKAPPTDDDHVRLKL